MRRLSILDVALRWRNQGIAPIPCWPRSKIAAVPWRRWQTELPPESTVRRWFGGGQGFNLGLVCGWRDLLALDFDDRDDYEEWAGRWPSMASSYTVATPRGFHVYLFGDPGPGPVIASPFEVKGPGSYIVSPPSVHPAGIPYRPLEPGRTILQAEIGEMLTQYRETQACKGSPETVFYTELRPSTCGDDLVSQIRAAVPILSLVSRFTKPIPSGGAGRWYKALCPFHEDHEPSFWVDTRRGICGCHRPDCRERQPAGKAMDVVNLYARAYEVENREAIFRLAREMGS